MDLGKARYGTFKFTQKILKQKKITVFNKGQMSRDFTYIDDVIDYTYKIIRKDLRKKLKIQFLSKFII